FYTLSISHLELKLQKKMWIPYLKNKRNFYLNLSDFIKLLKDFLDSLSAGMTKGRNFQYFSEPLRNFQWFKQSQFNIKIRKSANLRIKSSKMTPKFMVKYWIKFYFYFFHTFFV
ncbi:MAG: hypothetical protein Q7U04_09590, partial [Bacteriovorax sp.]|nr:hypothetical protein [Bacteriovorax sp.]